MGAKISIIIPVYKVEQYLRQCLDSIVHQTYRDLEIILVDDGSPDNCGVICDEYAQKDERVIVIHKENGGVNTARNLGIQKATGDWLAFVDSDDWCDLDYYEKLMDALGDLTPDIFMAGGYIKEYYSDTKTIHTFNNDFYVDDRNGIEELMENIIVYGLPWDKIYKVSFFQNNQLSFDTSVKSFDDIWANLQFFCAAKSVGGCISIGYHYRQVPTSITKGFNPSKPQANYSFVLKLSDFFSEKGLRDRMTQTVNASAIAATVASFDSYYLHPANKKPYREIAKELKDMKTWPHIHEAIWSNNNTYLTKTQVIWKYTLRLPWIWPLKVVYVTKEKLKHYMGRNPSK